jgi:glycosyltransferase involved in cell wall biosynthesis
MPLVSVIIPVHNRAAELEEALRSVASQTLSDFECLVVDDRSTDGAVDVARRFAAQDARFIALSLPAGKTGAPAGRNLGFASARGEFCVFLDSDDLLSGDCLARRVDFLRQRPSLDFCVSRTQLFRHKPLDIPHLWNADTHDDDLDRFLRMDVPWQTTGPTWRTHSLKSIGGWDEAALSGQDWEFHIRVLLTGMKYERTGLIDSHWRVPADDRESIGKDFSMRKDHVIEKPMLLRRLLELFKAKGQLDDPTRRRFAAMFWQSAEMLAARVSRAEARKTWTTAHELGLISPAQHALGNKYFFWQRWPGRELKARREIDSKWPKEFFIRRGKCFNRAPADPDRSPVVSVITSAFNNEAYIRKAVESIQKQTFRDFEFIIVNDGSTDRTGDILRELADSDCRIRVIDRANKGLTKSLNEALSHARGRLIARMDGDDIASRDRFERQVACLDAKPDVVLVGTGICLIDVYDVELSEPYQMRQTHDEIVADLLAGKGGALCHPSTMMRHEVVKKVGGYRDEFDNSEDLDLFLRLTEAGRAMNLPEVLLRYRRHLSSVNQLKFANQARMKAEIIGQARARRGLAPAAPTTLQTWTPPPHWKQLIDWGWNAVRKENRPAARGHALNALRKAPMKLEVWKLLLCTLKKNMA